MEKAHIEDLTAHLKALEKKRSRFTQEEQKTGNNQTEGWNQWNRNTENNPKNQWNQKPLLGENQQDRQTPIQTNQMAEREHAN